MIGGNQGMSGGLWEIIEISGAFVSFEIGKFARLCVLFYIKFPYFRRFYSSKSSNFLRFT